MRPIRVPQDISASQDKYLQEVVSANLRSIKKRQKSTTGSSGRILKKTSVKLPSYSATNLIKSIAKDSRPLVREVPKTQIKEDKRNLYFKDEFIKESNSERNWLLQ